MQRFRVSGKMVDSRSVQNRFGELRQFIEQQPLAGIEGVRHTRNRSYELRGQQCRELLAQIGWIDPRGRNFPVHDTDQELISECVQGDGLQMEFVDPFTGKPMIETVRKVLADSNRTSVNCLLTDQIIELIEEVNVDCAAAIPELIRMVRGGQRRIHALAEATLLRAGFVSYGVKNLKETAMPFAEGLDLVAVTGEQTIHVQREVALLVDLMVPKAYQRGFVTLQSPYLQTAGDQIPAGSFEASQNGHATNGATNGAKLNRSQRRRLNKRRRRASAS